MTSNKIIPDKEMAAIKSAIDAAVEPFGFKFRSADIFSSRGELWLEVGVESGTKRHFVGVGLGDGPIESVISATTTDAASALSQWARTYSQKAA